MQRGTKMQKAFFYQELPKTKGGNKKRNKTITYDIK